MAAGRFAADFFALVLVAIVFFYCGLTRLRHGSFSGGKIILLARPLLVNTGGEIIFDAARFPRLTFFGGVGKVSSVKSHNHLQGARVYLSGPMDFVASRATEKKFGWRNRVGDVIRAF